ncbi:major facilitator superfamily domain-containing protein [Armillaria novae-zelandiae]|uniref:Major facilitator superfamily domain-containing protein n=1 Tax=Armillaria novae-zelandiae TaxID=153914 RepID=A0AA39PRX4_9AGAR|nr:major facilitator superfamily domain-containing protein [Armillaria novae-zelandiae]
MVQDIFRDSTIGQAINYISNGRLFPYADQRPDFKVPPQFLYPSEGKTAFSAPESDATTICGDTDKSGERISRPGTQLTREDTMAIDGAEELAEKKVDDVLKSDPYTVGWYGDDDPENPRNWSPAKRAFVAFNISLLTFSVYIGSAIYTPSIPGIMADFNVTLAKATLGLTLYVLAYGIGPMFLSPLQELPKLGRNPVYMGTLLLFVIFQVPVARAQNMNTILAFRFLTGFTIYPMHQYAYVLGIWALGAVAGPISGPVAKGWRWPQYELLWIAGFSLVFLLLLLPETYEPTILLRRAQRLRKLTGNQELRSQSERAAEGESFAEVMKEALTRPVHSGQGTDAIFYLWFEAFPLVFVDIYHFTLGTSGLPFLGFFVTGAITYFVYVLYQMYHIAPRYARAYADGKEVAPEIRLEIGLMASIFIPTSVLIFGFASKESIHWIVPVIGASLYLPGIYLCFQSILTYITSAYPAYAASVLAGNDLFRSSIASVFPLFGRTILCQPWTLWKWGHILRKRSQYAN